MEKIKKYYAPLWFFAILLAWEISSRTGFVSRFILPPFSEVMIRLGKELFSGDLGVKALNSLMLIFAGCAISMLISVGFTIAATRFEAISALFNILCTIFNPLPGVALLPLIMMWFGIGNMAMIVLIVHGVVWPLTNSLITGYRSLPAVYREYADNIGLSHTAFFFKILIFAILPNFLDGLRIGWGRAWRALISAEMIFGTIGTLGGIGYYIYTNRVYADITGVLAGSVVIVIIGVLVERLFKLIEDTTVVKWGCVHD